MMGIVNPNSLPYTIHKEEVELDENKYTYTVVHAINLKRLLKQTVVKLDLQRSMHRCL